MDWPPRILILDTSEHQASRVVLADRFGAMGYFAFHARTIAEAVKSLQNRKFDFFITYLYSYVSCKISEQQSVKRSSSGGLIRFRDQRTALCVLRFFRRQKNSRYLEGVKIIVIKNTPKKEKGGGPDGLCGYTVHGVIREPVDFEELEDLVFKLASQSQGEAA